MDKTILMELTADIVSAHVGHNRVEAADVPRLVQSVFGALASTSQPVAVTEEPVEPKVPVRTSVKPDAVACLECGAKMKMLKRHLAADHGLTPDEYRRRWNLAHDYPMVAPTYSAKRQELAKKIGLGRKPGKTSGGESGSKAVLADAE